MKNYTLILWFFLFPIVSHAQNNIDTYKAILDTTTNKHIKLQYLDSILISITNEDAEKYVPYAIRYIDLAEELEEYEKMADKTTKVFYSLSNILNKKEKALELIENVQKYEEKIRDSFLLGNIYLKKGGGYYGNDFKKAIENYSLAINKFSKKDTAYIADSYLYRAHSRSKTGDFVNAINDYKIAKQYYEDIGDIDFVLNAMAGISTLYEMNKFYVEALKKHEEVIVLAEKHNKYGQILVTLVNRSIQYKERELYDKQEEDLLRASQINKKHNNNDAIYNLYIHHYLCKLYASKDNKELAEKHLKILESQKDVYWGDEYLMNIFLEASAAVQVMNGEISDAIIKYENIHDYNSKNKHNDQLIDIKKELAQLYEINGNKEKAYEMSKSYHHLKDSVFNIEKTNTLAYYQTLYETEKKEREIIEKNASIVILEKDNKEKRRLLFFSISGLVLVFSSVFLYRNRKHLKKEKELQESFSQQLLSSQEEERKRISKDLHDGLGQSLLLIKNKVALNSDDNTKNMFNDAIEEVRTISRALHPFQLEKFGITKAIQNIIDELDESSDIFISSEIDDISNILSPEKEVNLYRIVQESISNIIKHSEGEAARIEIQKKPKYIHLRIKDNGKGFDFSEKHNDFNSLGLKTLKERTKFLKGTMKVDSEKNKGTTLEFVIPVV